MSLSALATLLSLTIACFKEYRPRWLLKGGPECPLSNTRPGPDKSRVGRSAGRRAARLGLGEEAEAGWAWTPRLASNQGKRKIRTGVAGNGGWDEREQKGPTEGERGCGAGRSRSASTSSAPSLSTLRDILYLSVLTQSPAACPSSSPGERTGATTAASSIGVDSAILGSGRTSI